MSTVSTIWKILNPPPCRLFIYGTCQYSYWLYVLVRPHSTDSTGKSDSRITPQEKGTQICTYIVRRWYDDGILIVWPLYDCRMLQVHPLTQDTSNDAWTSAMLYYVRPSLIQLIEVVMRKGKSLDLRWPTILIHMSNYRLSLSQCQQLSVIDESTWF